MMRLDGRVVAKWTGRSWVLWLLWSLVLACAKPTGTNSAGADAVKLVALDIPPLPGTLAHLDVLQQRADDGDIGAAWTRAHYLLDVFDSARFGRDEESRKVLAEISDRPGTAIKGAAATVAIAKYIAVAVDHVLELDRNHEAGQRAQVLLSFDISPPVRREDVFQRMEELRRVLRKKKSVLAFNARVRMFSYCKSALQDAQHFMGPTRRIALSHCLYPLYRADPEPYFHPRASERPPSPQWGPLVVQLRDFIEQGNPSARLKSVQAKQLQWASAMAQSPVREDISPVRHRLPEGDGVTPYDDFPLLAIGPNVAAVQLLGREIAIDGRGTAAIALPMGSSAQTLLEHAQYAQAAGANRLVLLLAMKQQLSIAKNGYDYWSAAVPNTKQRITRVGELPVFLRLSAGPDAGEGGNKKLRGDKYAKVIRPKGQTWSSRRSQLQLHLRVSPSEWRLVSAQGTLPAIAVSATPRATLRKQLQELRRAYPDEDGLSIVPSSNASYDAVLSAALAAIRDGQGRPLFSQLAISDQIPPSHMLGVQQSARLSRRFQQAIRLRARAEVTVEPAILSHRMSHAKRCYQQALSGKAGGAVSGSIRLELRNGTLQPSGGRAKLRACAVTALVDAMKKGDIPAAVVSFHLRKQGESDEEASK